MILEEQVVVIECRNKNERDNIISLFQENGFIPMHSVLLGACYIAAYKNTKVFSTFSKNVASGGDVLYTHNQFMEKYSNKGGVMNKQLMISIIDAAKKQLNVGNSELSLKLGHNRNYISRVLHQENPTPEQMTKVFDKVRELLPEFKHTPIADAVMVSKDEYSEMYSKNTALCVEVGHLKKEVEYKNQVLDNHINRVNELELQLKTTQQKFVDVVRLNEKVKKQASIYLIIIVIISLIGIMGFAS